MRLLERSVFIFKGSVIMKRIVSFVLMCALLMFAGCVAQNTNNAPEKSAVIFTDDLGRTVSVSEYKRTAALIGSFADVWQLAGGNVCASADDAWDDFELYLPEDTVNLGKTKEISLEKLLYSDPDFVLASANTKANLDIMQTLENAGITVAYFDVSDFEDYLRMLKICTDITGRADLYEANGLSIKSRIDSITAYTKEHFGVDAPTVLCLRASAASIRAKNSKDNVLGEMLASLGCINIADSEDSLLENLSVEKIMLADPDFIFTVQVGDDTQGVEKNLESFIADNPAWSELSAVKNGRVYHMDKRLYNLKPNALWAQAYEQLKEILIDEQT